MIRDPDKDQEQKKLKFEDYDDLFLGQEDIEKIILLASKVKDEMLQNIIGV